MEQNLKTRLIEESKNYTEHSLNKALATFVLKTLEQEQALEQRFIENEFTLKMVIDYVVAKARKLLSNQNGAIEQATVLSWVMHFLQDEVNKALSKEEVHQESVDHQGMELFNFEEIDKDEEMY